MAPSAKAGSVVSLSGIAGHVIVCAAGAAVTLNVRLTGDAGAELKDALGPARVALVLGAEGPGLRPNTREHCDALARLPIGDAVESLNVSNAAAVALYAASTS